MSTTRPAALSALQPRPLSPAANSTMKTVVEEEFVAPSHDRYDNAFVRFWRKFYHPLHFEKGYNFPLCTLSTIPSCPLKLTISCTGFIFGGAMFSFCLGRAYYLNFNGIYAKNAAPGEWYWSRQGHYHIGIIMHLVTVIPAGLLLPFQFIPLIRHKALLYHRVSGCLIILLSLVGLAGALMIVRRSFDGTVTAQAAVDFLAILIVGGFGMAYYNIKRLQLDQHRAWMLRTVFWLGTIITLRIIMISAASIISMSNNYYMAQSCDVILFMYGGSPDVLQAVYPQCAQQNATTESYIAVKASLRAAGPENVGDALDIDFGVAVSCTSSVQESSTDQTAGVACHCSP